MNRLTKRTTNGPLPVLVRDRAFGPAYFVSEEDYTDYRDALEKLARYEDSGLEPEQCAKFAQTEKEGRYIVLKEPRSAGVHRLEEIARADIEDRLLVLPCGDDVTLEYNGLLYKGDHWNPPTLTAFTDDPSTRSGLRVHIFRIEDAEKSLEGMNNDHRID